MMRVALHVQYDDGSGADVMASAPDLIAFERHFNTSMVTFNETFRVEHVLFLAWTALHRRGVTTDDFDTWCERVDSVEFGDVKDAQLPPLGEAAPTG